MELGEIWLDRTHVRIGPWVTQCSFDRLCACFMGSIEIWWNLYILRSPGISTSLTKCLFPGTSLVAAQSHPGPTTSESLPTPRRLVLGVSAPPPSKLKRWKGWHSDRWVGRCWSPPGRSGMIPLTWAIPLLTKSPFSLPLKKTEQFTSVY